MQGDIHDHRLAAGMTLLLLTMAAAALLRQRGPLPPDTSGRALQVTWIEAVAPAEPPQGPPPVALPQPRTSVRAMAAAVGRDAALPPLPAAALEMPAAGALQAVDLARQAGQWARDHARIDFAAPSTLIPRPALDIAPRVAFRMREQVSPAAVVRGIGTLFGGPGYETDPCPRVRRNLAALAGGDGALLEEEVRRLQALCR